MVHRRANKDNGKGKTRGIAAGLLVLSLALFLLTALAGPTGVQAAAAKHILILHSFNQDYPIQGRFVDGLHEGGRQPDYPVRYSYESLNLPAFARDRAYQGDLAGFLQRKYRDNPPDVIVVQSKPAADFMLKYGEQAFGRTPVVIAAADDNGFSPENFPANYTAVFGTFDIRKAATVIVNNQPAVKKIYIILGKSPVEQKIRAAFTADLAGFDPAVEFIFLSDQTFPQMLATVKNLKGAAAVLYTYTYSDAAGNTMIPAQVLPDLCAAAGVPVYAMLDTYFGTGSVGGYMASWELLGRRVAEVADSILRGRAVGAIPVETYEAAAYRFDWRQLQRFDIDEARLPAGSIVDYKVPGFWEAYRWQILAAIALIILETILVLQLLINHRRRKKAEHELRELNAELEAKVAERTRELQEINVALEEEIHERQAAEESLLESRDKLLASEDQLKRYAGQLEETNQELKSFANIIAHDFRSPMVNLKGFSHELGQSMEGLRQALAEPAVALPSETRRKVDGLLKTDVPEALDFIYSSVDRLDRMVNVLLSLARQGRREMKFEPVDMNQVVRGIRQSFARQIADSDIDVVVGPLPTIETDRLAVEQILANLIDNAVKYLEPGRRGRIAIAGEDRGDEYLFTVEDNGRGIAAADLPAIFDIFRRVGRQDVPGDGIGLAFVRTLARQLGGKIACRSELGAGTTMLLTLPKKHPA